LHLIDHENNKKLKAETFKILLAYIYLENANQAKYGSILAGLVTQQSLGNNQYSRTGLEANNL
jgi:hypothetical protein